MNESKSQHQRQNRAEHSVVTNIRISMNESKSQLGSGTHVYYLSCYKYQNINERKQITTVKDKKTAKE